MFTPNYEMNRDKWDAYLTVQKSGLTNMFDVGRVEELAWDLADVDLNKDDIMYIIKHYDQLQKYYRYGVENF